MPIFKKKKICVQIFICLNLRLSEPLFVQTSVCPNLCLSESLFVRTSVCLNLCLYKALFVRTYVFLNHFLLKLQSNPELCLNFELLALKVSSGTEKGLCPAYLAQLGECKQSQTRKIYVCKNLKKDHEILDILSQNLYKSVRGCLRHPLEAILSKNEPEQP